MKQRRYTGTREEAYERVKAHLEHVLSLLQLVTDIVRKYKL
jgi:hypothetical protein